jgi:hypothetical protein
MIYAFELFKCLEDFCIEPSYTQVHHIQCAHNESL